MPEITSYQMFTFEDILFQQGADDIYSSIWVFHDRLNLLANPMSPQLTHDSFSMEKMKQ